MNISKFMNIFIFMILFEVVDICKICIQFVKIREHFLKLVKKIKIANIS